MPSCLGIHFSDNVIRYAKLVTDSANNVRLDHYGTRIAKGIRKDILLIYVPILILGKKDVNDLSEDEFWRCIEEAKRKN